MILKAIKKVKSKGKLDYDRFVTDFAMIDRAFWIIIIAVVICKVSIVNMNIQVYNIFNSQLLCEYLIQLCVDNESLVACLPKFSIVKNN